ncbi:MAG: GNAT family N-acetyltransferase [Bacteroidaceae bacterium]|nr:GNAT family N-acetyltransferase [Bacteroidaceae bacterium]
MDQEKMRVKIINIDSDQHTKQVYFKRIRKFLTGLECNYPFFHEWLERVFKLTDTPERTIVVCEEREQIAGLVILKDCADEKKICTFRVAPWARHQGIGTFLLKESRRILRERFPLITVSDEHIDEFKSFLEPFGFEIKSQVMSLYRYGHYEYYFNRPYVHKFALMSIHPQYAQQIMSGKKTVEFRKVCFRGLVKKVYVYSASPVKRVVGYFEVGEIAKETPVELWGKFGKQGGIDKESFFKYFDSKSLGYGIGVKKAVRLKQLVTLDDIFDEKIRAPQNFVYIDNIVFLRRLLLLE